MKIKNIINIAKDKTKPIWVAPFFCFGKNEKSKTFLFRIFFIIQTIILSFYIFIFKKIYKQMGLEISCAQWKMQCLRKTSSHPQKFLMMILKIILKKQILIQGEGSLILMLQAGS